MTNLSSLQNAVDEYKAEVAKAQAQAQAEEDLANSTDPDDVEARETQEWLDNDLAKRNKWRTAFGLKPTKRGTFEEELNRTFRWIPLMCLVLIAPLGGLIWWLSTGYTGDPQLWFWVWIVIIWMFLSMEY